MTLCSKDCPNKTEYGYCKLTTCCMPDNITIQYDLSNMGGKVVPDYRNGWRYEE